MSDRANGPLSSPDAFHRWIEEHEGLSYTDQLTAWLRDTGQIPTASSATIAELNRAHRDRVLMQTYGDIFDGIARDERIDRLAAAQGGQAALALAVMLLVGILAAGGLALIAVLHATLATLTLVGPS